MVINPENATPIPAVNAIKTKVITTIKTVDALDPRIIPSTRDPVSRYAEHQNTNVTIVPKHLSSPLINAITSRTATIPPTK